MSLVFPRMPLPSRSSKPIKNCQVSGTQIDTERIAETPSKDSMTSVRPTRHSRIRIEGLITMNSLTVNILSKMPIKYFNVFMISMGLRMPMKRSSSNSTILAERGTTTMCLRSQETPPLKRSKNLSEDLHLNTIPKQIQEMRKPKENLLKLLKHLMPLKMNPNEKTIMIWSLTVKLLP